MLIRDLIKVEYILVNVGIFGCGMRVELIIYIIIILL